MLENSLCTSEMISFGRRKLRNRFYNRRRQSYLITSQSCQMNSYKALMSACYTSLRLKKERNKKNEWIMICYSVTAKKQSCFLTKKH